jgi:hypothetical protein
MRGEANCVCKANNVCPYPPSLPPQAAPLPPSAGGNAPRNAPHLRGGLCPPPEEPVPARYPQGYPAPHSPLEFCHAKLQKQGYAPRRGLSPPRVLAQLPIPA